MKSYLRRSALRVTRRLALGRVEYLTRRYDRSRAVMVAVREAVQPASMLRHLGVELGSEVRIRPGLTIVLGPGDLSALTIGDNVFIGSDVLLDLTAPLRIGDDVLVGGGVQVWTHVSFGSGPLAARYPAKSSALDIQDGAYLAPKTTILESVTAIGARTVTGVGAILHKDTPPDSTWVGLPARRIST